MTTIDRTIRHGPNARPSGKPRVLADPRQYNTLPTQGSNTGFTTLYEPIDCTYEKVIASTPGLTNWWTMDKLDTDVQVGTPTTGFRPSAGASILSIENTVLSVTGLLPGSKGKAAKLVGASGAYLHSNDYHPSHGNHEIATWEMVVNPGSFPADSALMAEWLSNSGWLLGFSDSNGSLYLNIGNSQVFKVNAALPVLDRVYHVVVTLGGTQQDYYCRMYVNGVQVAAALNNSSQTLPGSYNDQLRIGTYANNAGQKFDCTYQHIAFYSRMLQPAEVRQHYEAGFARL